MKTKLKDSVVILDSQRIPLSSVERNGLAKVFPYYGAQGIIDYVDRYIFDGEFILVAEDGNNLKSLVEPIATWATGKFWVNNHAHILGEREGYCLKYIFYVLNTLDLRGYITGSAQPKLNQENLANIELDVPDFDTQCRIAQVLSSIDEMKDNNSAISMNLEAMAKLLYDYWFVQFDFPDENGKPYKSSGGKMVWSEQLKREIPEGWIVTPLSNYLNCNLNTITQNNLGEYIAYLDTGSLTENVIDQIQTINRSEGLPSRARRVIKENDILYSTVRPIQKHYGIIKHPVENMIASTGFAVLSAKQGSSYNELFYLFITSEDNLRILDTIANNSVSSYPSINSDDILNLKIALPPDITCLKGLCGKLQNCYEMIDAKHKENKELEQLRDFLLPMLMNGQVKA